MGHSSSSPDTPRTKVVLQSHQFSSSSSPDKVVLQSRQCSPACRALDTRDLRRGLRGHRTNRTLACILRARHARSPQRVARAPDKSHSRLHFAHSTRTISAEGCARMGQIALSPAFRALDTHDLRRGFSKTSVSYETSSKTHTSKSAKRAFRTRLPPKVKRIHPSEHTHHAALPSSFAIPTTHNLTIPCTCHESFRVHTSNAHKSCACHEMSPPSHLATSRFPAPATRIALPRFKARTKSCACHEK